MKITHPVTRSAFGIAALAAIAILANWLVSLTPMGNRGVDFTENKIHTLSEGTKAILGELDTPVVIRYYASRGSDYMPEEMKIHMRRVDDMLKEYAALSKGKLRVENLDPEPDTDAEDSANLDGISGQRINDQNLFFGLAISCLDKTSVIPFLDPRDETMLEYHLSKAIAEVSMPVKPKIGIMSAFDLQGSPAMMPGQQGGRPWVIYQQLKQSYDVEDIPMDTTEIDVNSIKTLLLIHPAGITPETEFAIDQYLLNGGTVIACLDSYSVAAQQVGGGNPMMGMGGPPTTSTLPTLLGAWGVSFESGRTLADPAYATRLFNGQMSPVVLTLGSDAMPQTDNVITKDLQSVTFLLSGAFTLTGGGGVASNSLIRTTTGAGFVDSMQAVSMSPEIVTSFRSTGTAYDLLTHLQGTFKTAFPDGKPGENAAVEEENKDENEEKKEEAKTEWLKEGKATGNVFLIADVDAFYDLYAYDRNMLERFGVASLANGNVPLLLNLLDQAIGSKHLIGARSRAAIRRPFTVIHTMEADFNKRAGEKRSEYQEKEQKTLERIQELQKQRTESSGPFATPEQEAELKNLMRERVTISKMLRELEKDLQRQKDKLAGRITLLNVAVMPALVVLIGLSLFLQRRRYTRAR